MAFDGITIAAMVKELHLNLDGGRFNKIAQPEADELLITGKGANGQGRLLLSASASLPLIYFTSKNKPSPMTAPNFCMLLRKHIGSARVSDIRQPGMERVVMFELEHLNELGDPCKKVLIMELMGKHSNIIFCDDKGMILDSIKHVSSHMSSVREVLPGREYFIPKTQDKLDPLTVSEEEFCDVVCRKPCNVSKAVYSSLTGISPVVAEEICFRASIDGSDAAQSLDEAARVHLYHTFRRLMDQVVDGDFSPNIVYRGEEPVEYGVFAFQQYGPEYHSVEFESVSQMLETYYATKNTLTRIHQKSSDLRRIVQTALERNRKKYDLQKKQFCEANVPLRQQESRLTNEYQKLMAAAEIPFDGKTLNLYGVQKYFEHPDRAVRAAAAEDDVRKGESGQAEVLEAHADLGVGLGDHPVNIAVTDLDDLAVSAEGSSVSGLAPVLVAHFEEQDALQGFRSDDVDLGTQTLFRGEVIFAGILGKGLVAHLPRKRPVTLGLDISSLRTSSSAEHEAGSKKQSHDALHVYSFLLK